MTDYTPLTNEELAALTRYGCTVCRFTHDINRLIADLRASRAEVERHKFRADHAEAALGHMDRLLSENVDAGRERVAEVERLRAALTEATEEMEDMIAYVPDYFRKKWKHDEAIARAKRAVRLALERGPA